MAVTSFNEVYIRRATGIIRSDNGDFTFWAGHARNCDGRGADPTGAAVPGTTVTVRNLDTNIDKTVTTDSAGYYVIGYLIPG
jgi:hypothetical protein